MRVSINRLHDRVNQIVKALLFQTQVRQLHDEKQLNTRQYTIISQLLRSGLLPLAEMRRAPWYQSLYLQLTDKTRQRDLHRLRELGLVTVDRQERLWPGFVRVQSAPDE